MTKSASLHPSPEQLSAFGLGKLDAAAHADVERHVAACASCCEALRDVSADGLLRKLREADSVAGDDTLAHQGTETAAKTTTDEIPAQLREHPKFRVLQKLGGGGMGVVYKAEHRLMKRLVALKVINPWLIRHPDVIRRFHREVKAASRLKHPNIVVAYDADTAGDLHLLVMEFVAGASLDRIVASRGPLPISDACHYARQVADGLQHAHEHGMVHRDIKPQNLVRSRDGRVRILDFGLARLSHVTEGHDASLTSAGIALGTPDYIAPEQARDSREVDIRADIYSLGCTLFYLLTGQPPFPNRSTAEKLAAHLEHAPPALASLRDDLPANLCEIVGCMMAKDPDDRYQTPAEAASALANFEQTLPSSSAEPIATPQPLQRGSLPAVAPPRRSSPLDAARHDKAVRGAVRGAVRVDTRRDPSKRQQDSSAALRAKRNWRLPRLWFALAAPAVIAAALGIYFFSNRAGQDPLDPIRAAGPRSQGEGGESRLVPATSSGKRVLMVLPHDGFWWQDYKPVRDLLENAASADIEVQVASSQLTDARPDNGETDAAYPDAPVDLLLADARAADYDAVIFCGAQFPEERIEFVRDAEDRQSAKNLIDQMLSAGKLVASYCNGAAVLAELGLLDRREAAHGPMDDMIRQHPDVRWRDEPDAVVYSPPFLTGGTESSREFVAKLIERLEPD